MVLNTEALLRDEHINKITAILKSFVFSNPERLHLHVPQEVSVEYAKLKNVTVSGVPPVIWQSGSRIGFDVELSAVIITGPRYDTDGTLIPDCIWECRQTFVVSCSGTLSKDMALDDFRVRTIRIKPEKRYQDDSIWGIIIHTHQDAVKAALSAYISAHPDALRLPSPPWVEKTEGASLRGLDITWAGNAEDKPGMDIGFEIVAAAEISATERSKKGSLQTNVYQQWFTLKCHANLEESLQDFSVGAIFIEAVTRSEDSPMEVILPFVLERQLERDALKVLKEFGFGQCIHTPQVLDPDLLAQRMGLTIQYRHLSKEKRVFGAVFMDDCEAAFYRPNEDAMVQENVRAGTIIVDEQASQTRPIGSINNTIVHECLHWHRHRKAYYLARLIAGRQPISCLVDGGMAGGVTDRLPGIEWQANALAPKIQMPYPAFKKKAKELIRLQRQDSPDKPLVDLLPPVIAELADLFGVSKLAVKIRLLEVGYPEARGVLDYVDGRYLRPYAFAPGALEKNQTFTISAVELAQLYDESEELRERLHSGEYTVVESHVCLNDPRFVLGVGAASMLTEYARLHVDECCLKFEVVASRNNIPFLLDSVLFREESYTKLSIELHLVRKSTYNFNKKRPYESYNEKKREKRKQDFAEYEKQDIDSYENDTQPHIEDIVFNIQLIDKQVSMMDTFPRALQNLMKKKQMTTEALSDVTGISVSTINNYRETSQTPRLNNVVDICIALHLPYKVSRRLIELAGYSLNTSSDNRFYDFILCNYYLHSVRFCRKMFEDMQSSAKKARQESRNQQKK